MSAERTFLLPEEPITWPSEGAAAEAEAEALAARRRIRRAGRRALAEKWRAVPLAARACLLAVYEGLPPSDLIALANRLEPRR